MFFLDGGGYCCGRSSFLGLCPRNKKPTHDDIVFLLGSLHLFVGWVCGVSFVFTRERRFATVEHMLFQAPKAQHKQCVSIVGFGVCDPEQVWTASPQCIKKRVPLFFEEGEDMLCGFVGIFVLGEVSTFLHHDPLRIFDLCVVHLTDSRCDDAIVVAP